MTIVAGDDVERCADCVRPILALYAGGMGARGANFHFEVFARMGYEDVATKVQELYLDGRKAEAAAAIPLAMVEDVALVGPPEKIRDELPRWRDTCITTFLVSGPAAALDGVRRGDPGRERAADGRRSEGKVAVKRSRRAPGLGRWGSGMARAFAGRRDAPRRRRDRPGVARPAPSTS